MIGLLLGGSLAGLFALGVPIALALTLASALALQAQGIPLNAVVQRMFTALDSFPLAAIPFFILAGCLMERSGISLRLVAFARAMIGRRTGGLALVTVVAAMFFSAISGSSAATTAAIGTILIPAMVRHGYPRPFATSVQAASGELGVIIPPSIPMIIFALTAGVPVSIGDMFIAGIVPGLLIALSLMLTARLISQRSGFGETAVAAPPSAETGPAAPRKASGSDAGSVDRIASRREAFLQAALALLMPILVLGGIYGGVFTPTEAAMAAVGYAFVLGAFVYRSLTLSKLYAAFSDALIASVAILTIIAAANLFGWVLTINQIPGAVTAMFLAISDNPIVFLLMVNLLLLLIGMFLETGAAIIILAPTLTPVAMAFGIPPVHFGIVMIVNLAIGMTTPPLGVNLFVACQIAGLRVEKILRSMLPFYAALLLNLLLITYLPALSLTLPSLLR